MFVHPHRREKSTSLLHRNFSHCCTYVKTRLVKQLILPKMDYACTVWDPHHIGLKRKLESIQKRACKFILRDKYVDYQSALIMLDLLPSHVRRDAIKLTCCHKILHNNTGILPENHFVHRNIRTLRNNNGHQLACERARTDVFKYSFFVKAPGDWNSLPESIVSESDNSKFKELLHVHLQHKHPNFCEVCNCV